MTMGLNDVFMRPQLEREDVALLCYLALIIEGSPVDEMPSHAFEVADVFLAEAERQRETG
jgi:hypothetical protein